MFYRSYVNTERLQKNAKRTLVITVKEMTLIGLNIIVLNVRSIGQLNNKKCRDFMECSVCDTIMICIGITDIRALEYICPKCGNRVVDYTGCGEYISTHWIYKIKAILKENN